MHTKNTAHVFAVIAIGAICVASQAAATPLPVGSWARTDGESKIRISSCGKSLCAVNTWIRDPKSEEKAGDKLVMTVADTGSPLSGTAFDQRRNRSYKIELNVGDRTLTTRGCVLAGLLCKAVTWSRLD